MSEYLTDEDCGKIAEEIWLCKCGHDIGGEHNSLGCYGTLDYGSRTQRRCECKLTDDQGPNLSAVEDVIARRVGIAVTTALQHVKTHNGTPVTPANLRWAATHEALCRSYIFDVLMGLADALEHEAKP